MLKKKLGVLASALLTGAIVVPVMGQANDNGGGGGGGGGNGGGGGGRQRGGGGGGGGGGGNFGNFQQQMMDRLKTDLGATDDEMTALQPKIEAVMTAQRASRGNMFGGGGGRQRGGGGGGGNGGGGGGQPQSDVQAKTADLRTTLENKDSSPEDIKTKLQALRDARSKAKDELTKAQSDLKGMLTARQEAVLVEYGMLD